ncbi:hypothetical protein SLA2020_201580 [Shorea laevis]
MASGVLSTALVTLPSLHSRRTKLHSSSPVKVRVNNGKIRCKAASESSQGSFERTVYQGVYGPWTVEPEDVREVILYRSGLVTAAMSFIVGSSAAFLPGDSSLTGNGLVQYVITNPTAVWFVGPLFAALTGLVFKEGLCYGKLEAGILTFIIPLVLLGHLTGLMDDGVKLTLLGSWMALFVIFAGRKFTQPIKDDIGDKSIFMFNSLPEVEKKALIAKLEEQKYRDSIN